MTATATPIATNQSQNITETACLLNIHFGFLGNHKQVRKSQVHEKGSELLEEDDTAPVQVDADVRLVRVSKQLLDSKELKAIRRADGELKGWLREICLPSFFRAGMTLVKIEATEKIDARLEEHKEKRKELVDKFLAVYVDRRKEAEERLKDLFDTSDYPPETTVREAFEFEWQFCTFTTPDNLKKISKSFFEKEQAKAVEHWKQATAEITSLLRVQFRELVDGMLDMVSEGEDGKPKRFFSSRLKHIQEFIGNYSLKDVTDDAELGKLIKDAKVLLAGADPKQIRNDDAERSNLQKGFAALKEKLSSMVEEAGTRQIIFDEAEPEPEEVEA
jgi:hypothetical protein